MTSPIQEPSTDRALQGMAYQRDQIFRRPGVQMATASYARAWRPSSGSSYELVSPTVAQSIPFTNMMTNDTSVFVKSTDPGQLADSAVLVLVPGLYMAQCMVEYVCTEDMFFHQTSQSIGDVNFGFGGNGLPLIVNGGHGAAVGVVTAEDPQDESTKRGFDTRSAVWLGTLDTVSAQFFIECVVIDGGVDPIYVNQAWMWILHLPLASLTETDIF